jgi:hypothetical protein
MLFIWGARSSHIKLFFSLGGRVNIGALRRIKSMAVGISNE